MTELTREDNGGERAQRRTLRTSQGDQARGYLESLTESELIRELQHALGHAERLTRKNWSVVISSNRVEILAETEGGDSDSPSNSSKSAQNSLSKEDRQPRIKLPLPHKRKS
jgi:hypothetical protein